MSKPQVMHLITFRGLSGPMQQTVLSERTPAQWAAQDGVAIFWAQMLCIEGAIYAGFTKTHEGTSLIDEPKGEPHA